LPVDNALPGYSTFNKPVDDTRTHPKNDESTYRIDDGYDRAKDRDRVDVNEDSADSTPSYFGLGPKAPDYSKTPYPYRDDKPNTHNASRHSLSKCMDHDCDNPPSEAFLWAEGRARAWFCKDHVSSFAKKNEGDIDKREKVDGEVPKGWPKEKMAATVAALWLVERAPERLFPAHQGVRVARTLEAILSGLDSEIAQRSKSSKVTLRRADINNLRWIFNVVGNNAYTVKLRAARPKKNVTKLSKMDLKLACTCPAWRWQGPEYHAKQEEFQDPRTKLQGTASTPDIRDPERDNRVCKHVAAVLGHVQAWDIPAKRRAVRKAMVKRACSVCEATRVLEAREGVQVQWPETPVKVYVRARGQHPERTATYQVRKEGQDWPDQWIKTDDLAGSMHRWGFDVNWDVVPERTKIWLRATT